MTLLPWSPLLIEEWNLPLTAETLSRFRGATGPLKLVVRDDRRMHPLILPNEVVKAVPGATTCIGDIVVAQADWEIALSRAVAPTAGGRWKVRYDALDLPPALVVPVARVTQLLKHEGTINLDSRWGRVMRVITASALASPRLLGFLLRGWAFGWKLRHPLWPSLYLGSVRELAEIAARAYSRPDVVKLFGEEQDGLGTVEIDLLKRLKPGAKILDIGCGAGREAIAMARMGFHVTAIDASPAMIEALRLRAECLGLHIESLVGDIAALDVPSSSYDAAYVSPEVYSYIPGRGRRIEALRRIHTGLGEGGVLLLSQLTDRRGFLSRSRLVDFLRRLGRPIFGNRLSEPGDGWTFEATNQRYYKHRFFGTQELCSEIIEAGFRVEALIVDLWICRPR